MHPYEERPAQEHWEVEDPPDPTVARNGDEFLAELAALAQWSGLTPAQIEHRMRANGDHVPDGIVAGILHGSTLPSEELLVPILWALGCDDETVELWVWVRGNLVAESYRVPEESKKFSDGALAQAVKQRRDQSGWRGLHRRAVPDEEDDSGKYVPKRSRSRGSPLAGLIGGSWSSRAMVGLVVAGTVTLIAGVAVALSGGGEEPAPTANDGGRQTCCTGSATPGSQTPAGTDPTDFATATPTPRISSTRPTNSPTPRPTTTTQSPTPSPTQSPRLSGSGNASCSSDAGQWVVSVSVTVTVTGASGSDPQGQASHGGTSRSLNFSGSGPFNGQAQLQIGPDTSPVQGSVQWNATVSVPGGTVQASAAEPFECTGGTGD